MRAAHSLGVLALTLSMFFCALPGDAFAQTLARRVVVQRFAGPRGSVLRRQLIQDLEEHGLVVVPESEVRDARRRLGFERNLEDAQYTERARELNASAFVDGVVRRGRRRSWSLTVRVRDAADAVELGDATWSGRTTASLSGVRRNGYERLREHLETSRAPAPIVTEPQETPWYAREEAESPPIEEEPVEETPRDASTRYDSFRIALHGGTLFRSMDTMVQVYASQRGAATATPETDLLAERRSYQSGGIGHFEMGGTFEIYPGAFDEQPFPYLGALISFSHSIGVQSNGRNRLDGTPVAVPTDQLDFFFGARFRYRFGPARREPEIHFDAGWGMFQFNLGLDALQQIELDTIIPPMQHGYLQLAAGIQYGVIPTYLTLGLEVGGRIGATQGGDTRNVWGTTTAPSNGVLLGAEARVEIPEIVQGAFLALKLQYFAFITSFSGQVGCATPAGCDYLPPWSDPRPWEVWPVTAPAPGSPANLDAVVGGPAGDVTDHYVRLQLSAGYAFY